jgi:nicotinate-nucleotide pyrophosphorylase (carboxylating)
MNNDFEISNYIYGYLKEDGVEAEYSLYFKNLPSHLVRCSLYIKSDLILSGLPFFWRVFQTLDSSVSHFDYQEYEGKTFKKGEKIVLPLTIPFGVALTGERVALNLIQRSSSISTMAHHFSQKTHKAGIKVFDTRKTTPGLRWLEKYAVRMGGGFNHRLSQTDQWMIKDNHKIQFGGIKPSWDFFKNQGHPYKNIIVEVHNLEEIKEAIELGCKYFLIDNFSSDEIQKAVKLKTNELFYEVSGGINEDNIESFLITGVDAISIGRMTQFPNPVDLSFKFESV